MKKSTTITVASAVELPEIIICSDSKRNVVEIQTTFFRWIISPESARALAHVLIRCAYRAKADEPVLKETITTVMPEQVM